MSSRLTNASQQSALVTPERNAHAPPLALPFLSSLFLHIPSLPERGIDHFSAYVGDRESVVRTPPKNHMSINLLIDKNGVIITLSRGPRAAAAHKANNNNPARGHHQHRAFFPPTGQLIAKVSVRLSFFYP